MSQKKDVYSYPFPPSPVDKSVGNNNHSSTHWNANKYQEKEEFRMVPHANLETAQIRVRWLNCKDKTKTPNYPTENPTANDAS